MSDTDKNKPETNSLSFEFEAFVNRDDGFDIEASIDCVNPECFELAIRFLSDCLKKTKKESILIEKNKEKKEVL